MNQLYQLNPNLSQYVIDGVFDTGISLMVPKVQEIFMLETPQSWNDIGAKYGIDPLILMRVNGPSVNM
jgi:hypothetical protein